MTAVERVFTTNPEAADNSRLRVLFVSHTYVVGVNQGKLEAIAQNPVIQVGLLAPVNWKSLEWNRDLPLERCHPSVQQYGAAVAFTGRGGAHFYNPLKIWRVLQDFQPDIIQVEEEVFSLCALEFAFWARLTGKALVIFGWENQVRSLPLPRRWIRQFVLDTASLIIAGNHDGADLIYQLGYRGMVEVMPQMGVDPQFFQVQPWQNQSPCTIGFMGRLVPEKGIDTLIKALRHLRHQGLDCRLLLCGAGTAEAGLRQLAAEQQVEDWIIWQTAVPHEQVPQVMAQFDILVLPSRTTAAWKEQFGHVLIEAMAMGIVGVGSNSGEILHVIGRSELVFEEGNSEALAAILQRLVQEPTWRSSMRQYGLNRVQQLYTHDRIAERLKILWQKILGR